MTVQTTANEESFPEVSIVPCLNEADTLATCIGKAPRAFSEHKLPSPRGCTLRIPDRTRGIAFLL
jgi:hypothetical protein